jgi:hypothetical protein
MVIYIYFVRFVGIKGKLLVYEYFRKNLEKNDMPSNPRVVRMPQRKKFAYSFFETICTASAVELYWQILYHCSAGPSWLNI